MKANLRFIFTIVLIFCVSILSLTTIVNTQKSRYEGNDSYYVTNNPQGVEQDTDILLNAFNKKTTTVSAIDNDGRLFISNFHAIQLCNGRYPQKIGEFVAPESSRKISKVSLGGNRQVGTYKETFVTNGLGRIYRIQPGMKLRVKEIELQSSINFGQKKLLKDKGFVKINRENIERQINAESYKTIGLILKLSSIVLLFMAVISWLSFLTKQINDSVKILQIFTSFGAKWYEIVLGYLYLHRKPLLRVFF